jgi:hypothetical protein
VLGAVAGTGALRETLALQDVQDETFVLEQGDRCVELTPFSGDEPVEELYDYTYPKNLFDGPPGSTGSTYSSMGTTDLQRDRTSVLFLYDGPEGLSLVVVHGHVGSEGDVGGTVSFTLGGVPADATWIVRDDYYLQNGEQAASNFDRWDVDGTIQTVDWAYKGGRTDGGALRGLGSGFEIVVDPAFNDEAALAEEHSWYGPIEAWEALSGDREDPERFPLRLDQHVRVRTGGCVEETDLSAPDEDGTVDADEPTDEETGGEETTDGEPNEDETTADEAVEEDGPTDDEATTDPESADEEPADAEMDDAEGPDEASGEERRRRKHERKRAKHRRKHRKKRRKHERKRRKHERKHERKRRKHGRKRGNRGARRGEKRGREDD